MNNESLPSFTKYNSCQLKFMVSSTQWIPGMQVKDKIKKKKKSSKRLTVNALSSYLSIYSLRFGLVGLFNVFSEGIRPQIGKNCFFLYKLG